MTNEKSKRSTRGELEERIDFTLTVMSKGLLKSQVKTLLKTKYGVSARTCEKYIACAKEMARRYIGQSDDEIRGSLFAMLTAAMRDSEAKPGDRIRAVEVAMRLFGVDQMPQPVNVNVNAIMPVLEIEVTDRDDLERFLQNPELATLAYNGQLPGIPRDKAIASLNNLGMIKDGKLIEKPKEAIMEVDLLEGLEYDEDVIDLSADEADDPENVPEDDDDDE